MKTMPVLLFICLFIVFAPMCSISSYALTIKPEYTIDSAPEGVTWDKNKKEIVEEAIKEWTDRLCMPIIINIDFQLADLDPKVSGRTQYYEWDSNGLPTSAKIYINSTATDMLWDLNKVDLEHIDALTVIKHEIGHAIGFSTMYKRYRDFTNIEDNKRFYTFFDGDKDGVFWGSILHDYMLDLEGNHLWDQNDLMYWYVGPGERIGPSDADLDILHIAFGYPIHAPVPEPSSFLLFLVGFAITVFIRKRQAAKNSIIGLYK